LVDDLLEPRASVDWAVAQLETLAGRIKAWEEKRPYELVTYFDAERGKYAFKYAVGNPLPLLINAEAGAIINSIRSSLDILAVALAKRHGAANVKDVSFPVSASASVFAHSGVKSINRLSAQDRAVIEGLAPYKGGNDALHALHQMDITRKHRRLLTVHSDNIHFGLSGSALGAVWPYELPADERPEDKTILVWVDANPADCKAELAVEVTLARTEPLQPEPVVPALREFADLAYGIIDLFD
jgi:hypothetical protein